jgi:hypothetical protein
MIEIHIERARSSVAADVCGGYSASAVDRSKAKWFHHHPFASASSTEAAL